MLIARNRDRESSLNQFAIDTFGLTSFKNDPRFLYVKKINEFENEIQFSKVEFRFHLNLPEIDGQIR